MKLFLVRHTTVENLKDICYGQSDIGLAQTFENEKSVIMQNLQDIEFEKIYSSPLKRCSILAKSLTSNPNEIVFDQRLMELNFGKWEGKSWTEIEKTEEAKSWFNDYLNTSCPDGESYADLIKRIQNFISDLKDNKSNDNILIVCHGGVIRAFYSIINKLHPQKTFGLKLDYGQIVEIEINEKA